VIAPTDCDCRLWTREGIIGDGHHPTCEHYASELEPGARFLWNFETGEMMRAATQHEIELAEQQVAVDGLPLIELSGCKYVVGSVDLGEDERQRQETERPPPCE
jgi:hypothetical protein